MLTVPQHVTNVSHPLVRDMYIKKDFGAGNYHEDVLVIETRLSGKNHQDDHESFDSYLVELLGDLDNIKSIAEESVGHIDRIDIRTH